MAQYLDACRNAVRLVPDRITPFLVGQRMHLSAYGMYGYALMSSLTMRDFFDEGVRYHGLATPTVVIEWREESGAAVWRFPRLARRNRARTSIASWSSSSWCSTRCI